MTASEMVAVKAAVDHRLVECNVFESTFAGNRTTANSMKAETASPSRVTCG